MRRSIIIWFSLVLMFSIGVFAQAESEEAVKLRRELKLLEQILGEAKNLRLPENRALIFAQAANALWQTDEKRARELFSAAIAEVATAQTDALSERGNRQFFQALIYGQAPRHEIIQMTANHDAELALALFARSRPAAIAEALQNYARNGGSTIQQYTRGEVALEQGLLRLAAEKNSRPVPVERVRESLKKGVSHETVNLLNKIYAKDPPTAEILAAELAESFIKIDFSRYSPEAEVVGSFVAFLGKERAAGESALKIPDALLRRLVMKMTDDWFKTNGPQFPGYWNSIEVIGKLFPERAAQIKKRLDKINGQNQNPDLELYTKLISDAASPEDMIAQAEKFQAPYRNEIYRAAAHKYVANGNAAQAEKIMQSRFGDDENQYYLSQFYSNLANQRAAQDKFTEANAYVNRIEIETQRINALISLATTAYGRNPKENQKLAEGILAQARALIPDAPERQDDLNAAIYLASAYAAFAPEESFKLLESIAPTMNDLIQANFVVMKFRGSGVRQNEIQMVNGTNLGAYQLEATLRILKQKDFERTLQITNGFNRLEMRLWLQMQMVDATGAKIVNLPINYRLPKWSLS